MTSKTIAKALKRKLDDWCSNIDDEKIVKAIKENAMVTGGALVSMLNNEPPNDYDIYFKTYESCLMVARYYARKWNAEYKISNSKSAQVEIQADESGRITAFIQDKLGIAAENGENGVDDETEPDVAEPETKRESNADPPKYRPRYFTTNAIALSDKIQLVIRFYGSIEEIHTNYDFVHCTCSYDYQNNSVNLPSRALEAIINKELYYCGSKYPLCSIIRSRKFIERGWRINAGQYLKMCLQLNDINLKDIEVFADQLVGVDSAYFNKAISMIREKQEKDSNFTVDNTYLFEIINRIF